MPRKKNRKWVAAVLLATLFPALAVHGSCVAALGPGTWGSGLEEKIPEIVPVGTSPRAVAYAEEFAEGRSNPARRGLTADSRLLAPLVGKVFWTDYVVEDNWWVIATHEGPRWVDAQHVFLLKGEEQSLEKIALDSEMIIERPSLAKQGGKIIVVLGRWHSWAVPPHQKLARYVRSYLDPTLRPEFSLYLYDLEERKADYWGPGHTLELSPDRKKGVLLRSGALGGAYYSLHLWDVTTGQVETILSLREVDPGSGRSFEYRWSADSGAVYLSGQSGGFQRREHEPRQLNLIYVVDENRVYDAGIDAET